MAEHDDPQSPPDEDLDVPGRSGSPELKELAKTLKEELAPDLEVLKHLGSGSAAEVFLARQKPPLSRLVAVKVLSRRLAGDDVARTRFEREAKAAAALDHTNAVPVFGFGYLSDGVPYLVMTYIRGGTLEDRLEAEGPLSVSEARTVLAGIASALAAAHDRGFVHRDVRPANVLCDKDGERVLVTDFGLAGVLPESGTTDPRITRTGEILGLPPYLSPEQLRGEDATEKTDVYALGVLAYRVLTGEGPYRGSTDRELLVAHLRSPPRSLTALRPEVGPDLAALLEKCLAKEPGKRPSAAYLAQALTQGGETRAGGKMSDEGGGGVLESLLHRRFPQIVVITGGVGYALLTFVGDLADRDVLPEVAYLIALDTFFCGLAAAGVVAWFHGARGRQRVSAIEIMVLSVILLAWITVLVILGPGWGT
jgi:serine/threonine-protein kinase